MVGAEVRGVWDGFLQDFKSLQESLREALAVKSPVIWLLTALYPEIRVRGRDCGVDNRRNGASVRVKTKNCSSSTVLFIHLRCTYCSTCEWNTCGHFPELKASENLKPYYTTLHHYKDNLTPQPPVSVLFLHAHFNVQTGGVMSWLITLMDWAIWLADHLLPPKISTNKVSWMRFSSLWPTRLQLTAAPPQAPILFGRVATIQRSPSEGLRMQWQVILLFERNWWLNSSCIGQISWIWSNHVLENTENPQSCWSLFALVAQHCKSSLPVLPNNKKQNSTFLLQTVTKKDDESPQLTQSSSNCSPAAFLNFKLSQRSTRNAETHLFSFSAPVQIPIADTCVPPLSRFSFHSSTGCTTCSLAPLMLSHRLTASGCTSEKVWAFLHGDEQMRIGGDEGDKWWRDKAQWWK